MFSDKNLFTKSISKNSDSFDDRFCDDLCEDILQYLPLKDKIKLEFVSKQFQRTVFRRVFEFKIREFDFIWRCVEQRNEFELKQIEALLKKCPNIASMDLYGFERKYRNNSKLMLQMITKYCNHLIEFKGISLETNDCETREFCKKFGPKLKKLCQFSYMEEIIKFPNLQSLYFRNHVTLEQILQLNSKELKSLYISIYGKKEHMIREVLQKFHKIRHLGLSVNTDNQKSALNAFQDSPLLQNLIELKISENGSQRCVSIIKCLKQMAKKCPNLKRIQISYQIFLEEISDFEKLMSSLKIFPHLQRLDINLEFSPGLGFISFKSFPQQLTHLSLGFNGKQLNVSILNDIVINLTKLQYLEIKPKILTDEEGVTQIADILSRLSSLQTINLWLNYPISRLLREEIIKKCRKIRNIFY